MLIHMRRGHPLQESMTKDPPPFSFVGVRGVSREASSFFQEEPFNQFSLN